MMGLHQERQIRYNVIDYISDGGALLSVSIAQIAKHCGVSTATVSRVLNQSDKVTASTREKIMQAIEELGYSPNQAARNLRTQSTKMIGVIIPHDTEYIFNYPYFSIFLRELSKNLSIHHYYPILTTDQPGSHPLDSYRTFLDRKIVDAFLLLDIQDEDERVIYLQQRKAKFVVVGRPKSFTDLIYIDTDNEMGGYMGARYLLQKGYRRILFINGPRAQSVSTWRMKGFFRAHEEAKLPVHKDLIRYGDFLEKSGFQIVQSITSRFDAVFAASDLMAMGAIQALRERNTLCPVMGYDDVPMAATFNPTLSTVAQPIDQVGRLAAREIIHLVEKNQAQSQLLPISLVLRQSTEEDPTRT